MCDALGLSAVCGPNVVPINVAQQCEMPQCISATYRCRCAMCGLRLAQ